MLKKPKFWRNDRRNKLFSSLLMLSLPFLQKHIFSAVLFRESEWSYWWRMPQKTVLLSKLIWYFLKMQGWWFKKKQKSHLGSSFNSVQCSPGVHLGSNRWIIPYLRIADRRWPEFNTIFIKIFFTILSYRARCVWPISLHPPSLTDSLRQSAHTVMFRLVWNAALHLSKEVKRRTFRQLR